MIKFIQKKLKNEKEENVSWTNDNNNNNNNDPSPLEILKRFSKTEE